MNFSGKRYKAALLYLNFFPICHQLEINYLILFYRLLPDSFDLNLLDYVQNSSERKKSLRYKITFAQNNFENERTRNFFLLQQSIY